MTTTRLAAFSLSVLLCCALPGAPAEAAEIQGAWSTDASLCNKVFVKSGAKVSFAKDSELSGSGFVIDGREIRGPTATCRIKHTTEDGAVTHLIAACATDIMLSDVQLSLRSVNANEIFRLFPNMPGMETKYHRCSM